MTKDSEMKVFIQGMYGTMMGVSFYQITKISPDWRLAKDSTEAKAFLQEETLSQFVQSEFLFCSILFIFTLLIIAHDWYSYFKKLDHEGSSFVNFLPQIFALFCLSQMFVAIGHEPGKSTDFRYWFVFGFLYTICNIIGELPCFKGKTSIKCKKSYIRFLVVQYFLHVLITLLPAVILPAEFTGNVCCYYLAWFITFLVVIIFWILEWKNFNTQVQRYDLIAADAMLDNEKSIEALENDARTARRNFLDQCQIPSREKIDALEALIKAAENKAKAKREEAQAVATQANAGEISGTKK